MTVNTFLIAFETTCLSRTWRFSRPVVINRVWFVVGLSGVNKTLMQTITLVVMEWTNRLIDWNLMEVWTTQAA